MTDPLFSDVDLLAAYRAGHFDDLSFSPGELGDCACRSRAYSKARRSGHVQYGQVFPEEIHGCLAPWTWGDGLVRISCSTASRLWDALVDAGFRGYARQSDELLRRLRAWKAATEAGQGSVAAEGGDGLRSAMAPDFGHVEEGGT